MRGPATLAMGTRLEHVSHIIVVIVIIVMFVFIHTFLDPTSRDPTTSIRFTSIRSTSIRPTIPLQHQLPPVSTEDRVSVQVNGQPVELEDLLALLTMLERLLEL